MKSFKRYNEDRSPCWKGYRQVGMKKKGDKMVPNCVPEEVELDEMFNKVHPTLKKELGIHGSHAVGMAGTDKGVVVQFNRPKNTSELMKQMSKHGYKNVTAVGNQKNTYHFNEEVELEEGSESWEAGYKRRVVKTTKPEHKEKGYKWRIKGKDKDNLTIKLYKQKPSQEEFNKQMKRVAGHEFGG